MRTQESLHLNQRSSLDLLCYQPMLMTPLLTEVFYAHFFLRGIGRVVYACVVYTATMCADISSTATLLPRSSVDLLIGSQ